LVQRILEEGMTRARHRAVPHRRENSEAPAIERWRALFIA
jgi:hypothetical protein